jgi:predicted CXXCH cytochrome family protein
MASSNQQMWLAWSLVSAGFLVLLGMGLFMTSQAAESPRLAQVRAWFLPGQTSHAHYQIELACEACHVKPFGGAELRQQACEGCHAAELEESGDKHPLSKFTDPRNAPLLERIDATRCETCHEEHRPELTLAMAVTQPADLCMHCHGRIAEERPSHAGMKFDTCSSAGCHRYHDNQATYEDFLLRHAEQPALLARVESRSTNFAELAAMLPDYPSTRFPLQPLTLAQADAPATAAASVQAKDWAHSAHARQGVNCSACHGGAEGGAQWIARPADETCAGCHAQQRREFEQGRHGMRLALGLPPMRPELARLPMHGVAGKQELGCSSCHTAHSVDRIAAARDACLGCHADEHSLAFDESPHGKRWAEAVQGRIPPREAVSCATCHMPVVTQRLGEFDLVSDHVQHNQSATLRPSEKMLRPVCMRCHGLGYATDALADAALVKRNFRGQPAAHVPSTRMAVERDEAIRRLRQQVALEQEQSQ